MEPRLFYQFDCYRVDLRQGVLIKDDEIVPLGTKPFEILVALLERHGEVVKKEIIMEKVWPQTHVEETNLTFNINQLRKILGDDAKSPKYIETVRSRGYKFIAGVVTQPSTGERSRRWSKKLLWWPVGAIVLLAFGSAVYSYLDTSETVMVFPQFGAGTLLNNSANISEMKRELRDCQGDCLKAVQKTLVIDTVLEKGGYAVVNFEKASGSVAPLSRRLLFRVKIGTSDPHFEIGIADGKTTVHFDCRVSAINAVDDFLVDLADDSGAGQMVQPLRTHSLSVGVARDAGSMPGRHHLELYGMLSADDFADLNACQCTRRKDN